MTTDSFNRTFDDLVQRHGFGAEGTRHMFEALWRGGGRMAQFDHPAFGGYGQWMSGGMTMVSDMFDSRLKSRVDALCSDLARLAADAPTAPPATPATQSSHASNSSFGGTTGTTGTSASAAPRAAPVPRTGDWWPGGLGHPNSTGSQNGVRYAYFGRARRLVIERAGVVTSYDTQDHEIHGVSQQQSTDSSLRFDSQHGPVDLASLPVVPASN